MYASHLSQMRKIRKSQNISSAGETLKNPAGSLLQIPLALHIWKEMGLMKPNWALSLWRCTTCTASRTTAWYQAELQICSAHRCAVQHRVGVSFKWGNIRWGDVFLFVGKTGPSLRLIISHTTWSLQFWFFINSSNAHLNKYESSNVLGVKEIFQNIYILITTEGRLLIICLAKIHCLEIRIWCGWSKCTVPWYKSVCDQKCNHMIQKHTGTRISFHSSFDFLTPLL